MLHNYFPFTPIIMKLHIKTTHELRMCPLDFGGQMVKVTMNRLLKFFCMHNCFPFTSNIMKFHTKTPLELRMCPIDFGVKAQGHDALITKLVHVA